MRGLLAVLILLFACGTASAAPRILKRGVDRTVTVNVTKTVAPREVKPEAFPVWHKLECRKGRCDRHTDTVDESTESEASDHFTPGAILTGIGTAVAYIAFHLKRRIG